MNVPRMLPGDLLRHLLERRAAVPLDERQAGGLDPQTIAEFVEYHIPFETPPAQGFVFPSDAPDG